MIIRGLENKLALTWLCPACCFFFDYSALLLRVTRPSTHALATTDSTALFALVGWIFFFVGWVALIKFFEGTLDLETFPKHNPVSCFYYHKKT
jgi:hypothetical protein